MTTIVESLGDAYRIYVDYLRLHQGGDYPDANIKTALLRYTLPGYGLEPNTTKNEAVDFMSRVPLHQFKDALAVQQRVFESLGDEVSGAIKRNYRMHLRRMLEWCQKQNWWKTRLGKDSNYTPVIRMGRPSAKKVLLINKAPKKPYRLKDDELTDSLKLELQNFYKFLTSLNIRKREEDPINEVSANIFCKEAKLILGWLYHYQAIPLQQLSLKLLDDIDLAYDFLDWLRNDREARPSREMTALKCWLWVSKFHHHKSSEVKKYRDIKIIEELRDLMNNTAQREKETPPMVDESLKWLDWSEFLAAVERLKQECAVKDNYGRRRTNSAIAFSYERYLIAAFLAYMPPDRQRTLRELEIGRTLIKKEDNWFIQLEPKDYKTGKTYGTHITQIPEIIYPELEEWIEEWRQVFNPQHNFLFTTTKGKQLTPGGVWSLFTSAIFRLTGKKTNPHLIRSMIITHLRRSGATDQEMEALALGMKHSTQTQKKDYDRRTKQEKIAPALEMMLRQKPSTLPPPPKLEAVKLDAINK